MAGGLGATAVQGGHGQVPLSDRLPVILPEALVLGMPRNAHGERGSPDHENRGTLKRKKMSLHTI